jgi:hypothetical protein
VSQVIPGWRLDNDGHPSYWIRAGAHAGGQSTDDVVAIPAAKLARHTAVIAQSGSGKSFFLGRLIEEILLNTKAKVLVFDPNADFRMMHQAQPPAVWEKAGYDASTRRGFLPTERTQAQAMQRWQAISKCIFRGDVPETEGIYAPMRCWWPSVSTDLLAGDLNAVERSQLEYCHAFVQWAAGALRAELEKANRSVRQSNLLLDLCEQSLLDALKADSSSRNASGMLAQMGGGAESTEFARKARAAAQYASGDIATYYFAKARQYEAAGLLAPNPPSADLLHLSDAELRQLRLSVVDLPSIVSPEGRLLAVNSLLTFVQQRARMRWEEAMSGPADADRREPLFVVVEEAHNLIPAEVRSRAAQSVREQFRTIAAEGRKMGLFLIVVSQRPDKLDEFVLSECENRVVMRIESESVLSAVKQSLGSGTAAAEAVNECLTFGLGRALLLGAWVSHRPTKIAAAARRTAEGGRNLNEAWWANPAGETGNAN